MANSKLDSILAGLSAAGSDVSQMPIEDAADQIEMMAAKQLAAVKRTVVNSQLVDLVTKWRSQCEQARSADKQRWYKNMDMFAGRQFTVWNSNSQSMITPAAPAYEPRIAINITESVARTEMTKTGAKQPTAAVSPASNDDDDIAAARAAEAAWEWFYSEMRFQTSVFTPANWWRTIAGNGFIKAFQDWTSEDVAATQAAQKQYMVQVQQQQQQSEQQVAQGVADIATPPLAVPPGPVMGRIRAQAVSPFHLLVPDLSQIELQEQPYVIHQYVMPITKAKQVYKDTVPPDWAPTGVSANEIMSIAHLGVKGGNQAAVDSVLILEAWVKPGVTDLLPQGGLVIIADKEIVGLKNDGMPYRHGDFPFAHLPSIETGRFYRKSTVESIQPLQDEINRTYAQVIKWKNLVNKPQYFYDEGSVDPTRVTSKAGLWIPVRLGQRDPRPVPQQQIPAHIFKLMEDTKAYLDDISGQHQISRAQTPGADTAASALNLLQESDDNFLSTIFDAIEAAYEAVARQVISLMVQFWDQPRLVKVTGADESFDSKMLSMADLESGTDIRIEAGTALPISKAGKIATISDWMKNGFIPPDVGLEAMEMGTLGKVYEVLKIDKRQAQRENIEMRDLDPAVIAQAQEVQQQNAMVAQQQADAQTELANAAAADPSLGGDPAAGPAAQAAPPPVAPIFPINSYDNDAVHIMEHSNHMKGQAYADYDDEHKQIFEEHLQAHKDRSAAVALQTQQAQMGGPIPGSSGAGGGNPEGAIDASGAPDNYAGGEPQTSA